MIDIRKQRQMPKAATNKNTILFKKYKMALARKMMQNIITAIRTARDVVSKVLYCM